MPTNHEFTKSALALRLAHVKADVAVIHRTGHLEPIVFLHGFGSTKEDYADIARYSAFEATRSSPTTPRAVVRPGVRTCRRYRSRSWWRRRGPCSRASGSRPSTLWAIRWAPHTALMLAHADPGRVLSFVDIEGNIAPEDCFLSRQILDHPSEDAEKFFDDFIERTRHAPAYASALYSASLRHKVRAAAVPGIFRSMVDLSVNGGLME